MIDGSGIKAEHLPIQEQQRAERLVLGRRADLPFHREVRKIPTDLVTTHLRRMLLAVKDNEPPNPCSVGFFGPAAIVTKADRFAELRGDDRATLVLVVGRVQGRRKPSRSQLTASDDDAIVEGQFANATWPRRICEPEGRSSSEGCEKLCETPLDKCGRRA